jgi:hypothetical protein
MVDHTQRGAVAESMVCTWALKVGHTVSFPACGLQPPYDMIIDAGDIAARIQVKRLHQRRRGSADELRATIGSNSPSVDMYALVDVPGSRIWLIPKDVLAHNNSVAVKSGKYDEYLVQKPCS